MDDTWKKLSKPAQLLAQIIANQYQRAGISEFSLNDLRGVGHLRSGTILKILGELTSRGFGQLKHDDVNPVFIISRPRFDSLDITQVK